MRIGLILRLQHLERHIDIGSFDLDSLHTLRYRWAFGKLSNRSLPAHHCHIRCVLQAELFGRCTLMRASDIGAILLDEHASNRVTIFLLFTRARGSRPKIANLTANPQLRSRQTGIADMLDKAPRRRQSGSCRAKCRRTDKVEKALLSKIKSNTLSVHNRNAIYRTIDDAYQLGGWPVSVLLP